MRILFQGDSITDAHRRADEPNPAFQLGNGYVFLIAARLGSDGPKSGFEFVNRGVSGRSTEGLLSSWQDDAVSLSPDLLSLLVGINDVGKYCKGDRTHDARRFAANYRGLLDAMRQRNPGLPVILLEPFLVKAGPDRSEWSGMLSEIQSITAEVADEYSATFIPLQKMFDAAGERAPAEYWCYDGIHPTQAGFQLIADAWLDAVGPLLRPDGTDISSRAS